MSIYDYNTTNAILKARCEKAEAEIKRLQEKIDECRHRRGRSGS